MLKNKNIFFMFIGLVLSTNVAAQDLIELFFPNKSTSYMGVTLDNGKTRDGLGVLRLKNNGIFVGYFSHNKFNGKGMQIAPKNQTIENCGEGFIYIGRWLNGKKYGKGRLYNKTGQLIYDGRFDNDKPCEQIASYPDTLRKFSFLELQNNGESTIYAGEVEYSLPNGFGIYYDDECFTIVESKDGIQYGLGLTLIPSVGWSTFKVDDGQYKELDNSANLSIRRKQRKEERKRDRQNFLNALGNFANGMVQVAGNIQQVRNNETPTYSYESTSMSDDSGSTNASTSTKNNKYSLGDQQSYNTDKRTWGNYDGMLSAHFYDSRSATRGEVQQWQRKMKDLRTKWNAQGKSFPSSSNESRSTSNCPNTSHRH